MRHTNRRTAAAGLSLVALLLATPSEAAISLTSEAFHNGSFVPTTSDRETFLALTDNDWNAAGRFRRVDADINTAAGNSSFASGFVEFDQRSGYGVVRSNAELSGFYFGGGSGSPDSRVTNIISAGGSLQVPLPTTGVGLAGARLQLIFLTHGFLMLGGGANIHRASFNESISVVELNTGQNNIVSVSGQATLTKTNDFIPQLLLNATGDFADATATPRSRTIFPGGQILGPFAVEGYEIGDLHILDLPLPATAPANGLSYEITLQGFYEVMAVGSFYAYAQADFRNTSLMGFSLVGADGTPIDLAGVTFMGQPVSPLPPIPEPTGTLGVVGALAAMTLRRRRV